MKAGYLTSSLLHLFFPHVCPACGSDIIQRDEFLCAGCFEELPFTGFEMPASNPVERMFWGRIPVTAATSTFYFSQGSIIRQLIHRLKYKSDREAGIYLGNLMGKQMLNSHRFMDLGALIPLPLFAAKEQKRGYNQATLLCEGISQELMLPILTNNLIRKQATETQTKKGRTERWENVAESFIIKNPTALEGKHILLVDDVITTGATLEASGAKLLEVPRLRLSIATLAIAAD